MNEQTASPTAQTTLPAVRADHHGIARGDKGSTDAMNKQIRLRVLPTGWSWRHVVVCLLAVLIAVPAIGRTRSAAAAVPPPIDPSMICSLSAGCLPPAPLLNVETLQGGLHAATPEQAKSLRKLEEQAIDRGDRAPRPVGGGPERGADLGA